VTLWVCLDCSTAFAVGAPLCPHCGSERHAEQGSAAALGVYASAAIEEEDDMPKITRHGGASFPPADETADEPEGGEDVSAGKDSSTSSETPSTKPEQSEKPRRKPARTTGSRSSRARTESATAGSTDTSGPETDAADAPSK